MAGKGSVRAFETHLHLIIIDHVFPRRHQIILSVSRSIKVKYLRVRVGKRRCPRYS